LYYVTLYACLQDSGFCVPQLESVCQVQSWQGEVELSTSLTDTAEAEPGDNSSNATRSSAAHNPPVAAPASGQPAVPAWLQQVISQQQQQQQQQGQAQGAAAADSSSVVTAAAVDSGDAENAQALNKLGAVRRYNCMVADAPPALLQFLDDAADECIAGNAHAFESQSPGQGSGFGSALRQGSGPHSPGRGSGFAGSPLGVPRTHRLPQPRRQSFIVTDYFNFEGANSRIARTASGFVPATPSCTPGRPGALFGRRTSSGIESVSSLQSQRSSVSLLQSQRSNVSGVSSSTLQSSGGSLLSRRGSGVESVVSMRTSSGIDTASMRSNSGIDAVQLSRFGSDVSDQAHDSAAAAATAAEGVLPLTQQQQVQQTGPLRTSSGSSSTSAASSSGSMRSSGSQLPRRLPAALPLTAVGIPRARLPTVASGSNLGTLAEGEAETGGGSVTNQQQQQQQGLQGGLAGGGSSSLSSFGQLTNLWTSEGGAQKVVCVPRRTASANVAVLQQHLQMHQQQPQLQQQQSVQGQMMRMGMRDVQPSPVQVQLGAAAAKLLRVQSVNKPAASGPAGNRNNNSSSSSTRDAPGIIAGSLTQQQAAGIELGRLCGAGSFGRVYRWDSLTTRPAV
jgi:hypothetical protein